MLLFKIERENGSERKKPMNRFLFHFRRRNSQRDLAILRDAGCTAQEIIRLCKLRDSYQGGELDQPPIVSQNRLLFARWLIQRGKLDEGRL